MSRLDRKFPSEDALPADAAEILAALRRASAQGAPGDRSSAIARYLSAEDGWQDALERLGGAFAEPPGEPGLTRKKGE